MSPKRALAAAVLIGFSILGLIGVVVAAVFLALPNIEDLNKCITTSLFKVELCDKSPDYVTVEQVSPHAINAIIMSEDASFYAHDGIDVEEMKESFRTNLERGKIARGGSTITQQLVKNVFLTDEKSYLRKAKEVYLAKKLEKRYSKNKILTWYLNVVEFGPELFGIKKAARYYFNKPPSDLTPEEGAFLAFLLPNPKKYHQSFKQKKLTPFASQMVRSILRKMFNAKKINEDEYRVASNKVTDFFGPGTGVPATAEENSDTFIPTEGVTEITPDQGTTFEVAPDEFIDSEPEPDTIE